MAFFLGKKILKCHENRIKLKLGKVFLTNQYFVEFFKVEKEAVTMEKAAIKDKGGKQAKKNGVE